MDFFSSDFLEIICVVYSIRLLTVALDGPDVIPRQLSLADLHVSASTHRRRSATAFHPLRPYYLQSLLGATVDHYLTLNFSGLGADAALQGRQFSSKNHNSLGEVALESVSEWTYVGIRIHHPHMHVHHAQAMHSFVFFLSFLFASIVVFVCNDRFCGYWSTWTF